MSEGDEKRGTPYVFVLAAWLLTPVFGGHGGGILAMFVFFDGLAAAAPALSLVIYLVYRFGEQDTRLYLVALLPLVLYGAYVAWLSDTPQLLLLFFGVAVHSAYGALRSTERPTTF